MGPPRNFLISSQPLTHGWPGVALVSGAEWVSRFFITPSRTAVKTGLMLIDSGGCSCPDIHFHKSGFSKSRTCTRARMRFSSNEWILSSTHFPSTKSSSRNPRCLLLYNSLLNKRLLLSSLERSIFRDWEWESLPAWDVKEWSEKRILGNGFWDFGKDKELRRLVVNLVIRKEAMRRIGLLCRLWEA